MRDSPLRKPSRAMRSRTKAKGQSSRWAVVLAGGQGMRLRGLIQQVYGEERPKQFAVLTGTRSLLGQTLDRAGLLMPGERTLVIGMAGQMGYMAAELRRSQTGPYVLEQSRDRGTGAAILLSAHWICAQDPEAIVVVLPSDHFVGDDEAFADHVAAALDAVERMPERIVLLGARPTAPETEYGWIEAGDPLSGSGASPLYAVRQFIEEAQAGGGEPSPGVRRTVEHVRVRGPRRHNRRGGPGASARPSRATRPDCEFRGHRARAVGLAPGLRAGSPGELLPRRARAGPGTAGRHAADRSLVARSRNSPRGPGDPRGDREPAAVARRGTSRVQS